MMWSKDPSKNKWVLIAKVYSFVRDTVGKNKVPLNAFLKFACTEMDIVEPESYLAKFNWELSMGPEGQISFTQSSEPDIVESSRSRTESELLEACIANGYKFDGSKFAMEKLAAKATKIMSGLAVTPEPDVEKQRKFVNFIKANPHGAAACIFGVDSGNASSIQVNVTSVDDEGLPIPADAGCKLPMDGQPHGIFVPTYEFARALTDFPHNDVPGVDYNSLANIDGVYDISNPFDFDRLMGNTTSGGEGSSKSVPPTLYHTKLTLSVNSAATDATSPVQNTPEASRANWQPAVEG